MIYFGVKTSEYLRDVLDRVSLGAEYFCQFDVPLAKLTAVIEKLTQRYALDQTARQRHYRLQHKPVVDLVVLLNQSLYAAEKVRLCLLCTMPKEMRGQDVQCGAMLQQCYALGKSELDVVPVYELVQIPYTAEQRKQKNIPQSQAQGWTWRLHKKFIDLEKVRITDMFKRHQKNSKNPQAQDEAVQRELDRLWRLSAFRGVRLDIFNLNRSILTLYLSYFNRKSPIRLEVPSYVIKNKKTVNQLKEMLAFHAEVTS